MGENHERANFLALQRNDSHTNNIPPPTTPTFDEPLTPPSFDFLPTDFLPTRRLDQASIHPVSFIFEDLRESSKSISKIRKELVKIQKNPLFEYNRSRIQFGKLIFSLFS